MQIDVRRAAHLGSRLAYVVGWCDAAQADAAALLAACLARGEHELGGDAHALKAVCFSRVAGDEAAFESACRLSLPQPIPFLSYAQRPLVDVPEPARLMFLLMLRADDGGLVLSEADDDAVACRVSAGGAVWVSASARAAATPDEPAAAFESCLQAGQRALRYCGSDFAQLARTWTSYAGAGRPAENRQADEFQAFNRARRAFYQAWSRHMAASELPYCANTGLRDFLSGPRWCGAGVADAPGLQRRSIENPLQAAPSGYAAGLSLVPPLFSRGYATFGKDEAMVWVSGVVAVAGSGVQGHTLMEQAHTVLDNLDALLAPRNLANHGLPGELLGHRHTPYVLVAVTDMREAAGIRALLRQRLPREAMVFTVEAPALALPGLQIEIDCIAHFSCHPPP